MDGAAEGQLNAEHLVPIGQLPGSAQDSGVEEGCDDPDSNESSSTVSRGGTGVGFLRHNSSDRDGATAGEESNLSYGDPPSHPQVFVPDDQHDERLQNAVLGNGTNHLDVDAMEEEVDGSERSASLSLNDSTNAASGKSVTALPPSPSLPLNPNSFTTPFVRNINSDGSSSGPCNQQPVPSTSSAGGANMLQGPPPSVTEDGYLGDCSSDGGNEKNFPIPDHRLKRFLGGAHKNCKCHPHSEEIHSDGSIDGSNTFGATSCSIEPPAGLAFQNVQASDLFNSFGYRVLLNGGARKNELNEPASNGTSNLHRSHHHHGGGSRKMRSSLKSKLFQHSSTSSWSSLKASLAERKLRIAAGTNNSEQIERLIANGANPNAADEHKRSSLHIAAAKGYEKCIDCLLQGGANPNLKDLLGNTPLHLAACTNHIEVVTLLLRAGTNVETLDNNGRTPVQLAQSKLKLLQRNRINSHTGVEGRTIEASEMGKVKTEVAQVVEMMREYLSKTGHGANSAYNELLNSFSYRFNLHQTQDDINSDLQKLLDSLGSLTLTHQPPSLPSATDSANVVPSSSSSVSKTNNVPAATATSTS